MFYPVAAGKQEIVKDGLVLWLDANDKSSYPGSGTTWNDLSLGDNNGTLTNGPTYSPDNAGSIVFDGTDDKVEGTVSGDLNSNFTLEVWGKFNNNVGPNYEYFGSIGNIGSYQMMSMSRLGTSWGNSSVHGYLYSYPGNDGIGPTIFDVDLDNTDWNHVVISIKDISPYIQCYHNGTISSILQNGLTQTINTNSIYRIGAWSVNTWWLDGHVAIYRIYNKVLSSDEVLQNYNATKDRFGL